ncbi:PQQ-binding-like beta-propeller repeat protein [Roseiconus nitratireducens]|nr:PQQ-binding-like beta-propeller repeat protein [Roseiconus nitratireducens]
MLTRVVLAGCLALPAVFSAHADWPQWRGPNRLGAIESDELVASLPRDGLEPEWRFDGLPGGNSGGWGSPVISDGKVFVYAHTKEKTADPGEKKYPWLSPENRTGMSDAEYEAYEEKRRAEDRRRANAFQFEQRLVCLDLETGELAWEQKSSGDYTRFTQSGTPCVAEGKVLILGSGRIACCYDATTGELLWQQRLPGEFNDEFFASSFAVHDRVALIACGPLFALSLSDGEILWNGQAEADFPSHSSPAVWQHGQHSVAVCNTAGGRTVGYSLADGRLLWELKTGVERSSPIVAGDILLTYGGSRKNGLTAFQLNTDAAPKQLWQFRGAADSGSTPVVSKGNVFVQGEKRLAKVALDDGDRIWQTTLRISTPKYTSPIVVGDQLLFAWEGVLAFAADSKDDQKLYEAKIDSDGRLITETDLREKLQMDALEQEEDGRAKAEKVWQKNAILSGPLRCSTPAFSRGRLVIRLNDALVCYDLRKDDAESN